MKVQLPDGSQVDAKKLINPIGQFTHWYMNRNGEPRYMIIREADDQAYMFNEDVNDALSAALASGRYMICVFTADPVEGKTEFRGTLHRVTNNYPYDGFEFAKSELAKNLDTEYKPPTPLKLADFIQQGMPEGAVPVDEQGRQISIEEVPVNAIPNSVQGEGVQVIPVSEVPQVSQTADLKQVEQSRNDTLKRQIDAMNEQAEADGVFDQNPPKANVVTDDEPIIVAADPAAKQGG